MVVALGGDGLMLQALHRFVSTGKAIYGMNRGSVGFLMNDYDEKRLRERLLAAETTTIRPLRMETRDRNDRMQKALAFNEVSLFRQVYQAAKLKIAIDGKVRMEEQIYDGVLLSTAAGSTAPTPKGQYSTAQCRAAHPGEADHSSTALPRRGGTP